MNISGAIFDLDGTLLDSTEIWEGVAARYLTSLRKNPEPDLRKKTKAMTLPVLCSYLKDEYRIATTESKIAKGFNTILREDYLESADIKVCTDPAGKIQAERRCHVCYHVHRQSHRRRDPGTSGDP